MNGIWTRCVEGFIKIKVCGEWLWNNKESATLVIEKEKGDVMCVIQMLAIRLILLTFSFS